MFDQTEDRLPDQRTKEAGSALQLSVNQIRAPLDAAAKLAQATTDPFVVVDLLDQQPRQLGYAVADAEKDGTGRVCGTPSTVMSTRSS